MLCCPCCRSRDIFPLAGGYLGSIYLCKKCGYRGSFVIEIEEEDSTVPQR
jgi:hypothetical protein